jgi:DNA primase
MNIQQINEGIQITDFLEKLAILPAYKRGNESWYISPIREPEDRPSFKVKSSINRWYDHGTGEGGKLIDLALRLYSTSDLSEAIRMINDLFLFSQARTLNPIRSAGDTVQKQNEKFLANPKIIIQRVEPLEESHTLVRYLNQRQISLNTASPYCREVQFKIEDNIYQAIGFQNQSGGYELRNSWFKGASSPKDITYIDNGSDSVCLLEGFMDFLSLLEMSLQPDKTSDFLILNSLAMLNKSIETLQTHHQIHSFLDQDHAGKVAIQKLSNSGLKVIDRSTLYKNYKDVNEYLVAIRRQKLIEPLVKETSVRYRRGLGIR